MLRGIVAALALVGIVSIASAAEPTPNPPKEWVDADTGHHIVRLTDEPGSFTAPADHNNYTPDGRLVVASPTGIYTIDLKTRQSRLLIAGKQIDPTNPISRTDVLLDVGRKTGNVFYLDRSNPDLHEVCWIDSAGKQSHPIAALSKDVELYAVNCDETILAGTILHPGAGPQEIQPVVAPPGGRLNGAERQSQHIPMELATLDIATGRFNYFDGSTDWLGHVLFSPADPGLILYARMGPWQNVQRMWTIRTDGSAKTEVYPRRMINEIFGHEFFSADGSTIWFDLQTPRSQVFWVAGYNLLTGDRTQYNLERDAWSVHYTSSRDGTLFAGDGGGPTSVAQTQNGKWIFLYHPQQPRNLAAGVYSEKGLIRPGYFDVEPLVNMSKHDYAIEPNVSFTPDMKWIVFRSNMFGPSYVFAVEVAKAK